MNSFDYKAETGFQELFELAGRVKAFEAYMNNSLSNSFPKKLCAEMLGIKLEERKVESANGIDDLDR